MTSWYYYRSINIFQTSYLVEILRIWWYCQKYNVMSSFNHIYYPLTSFGTPAMKINYFFPFRFVDCLIDGQFEIFCFLIITTELSWWFCHFQILFSVFFKILNKKPTPRDQDPKNQDPKNQDFKNQNPKTRTQKVSWI